MTNRDTVELKRKLSDNDDNQQALENSHPSQEYPINVHLIESKKSSENDKSLVFQKLKKVMLLAGAFMIVEIIGGLIADSIAILSDAAHMLSDILGFVISVISVWVSTFPPNNRNSYGFHRAGVLGALTSVGLIWVLTFFLVYHAFLRIIFINEVEINAKVMLLTAIFGLITNIIMARILHENGHAHSHQHGSHDVNKNRKDYKIFHGQEEGGCCGEKCGQSFEQIEPKLSHKADVELSPKFCNQNDEIVESNKPSTEAEIANSDVDVTNLVSSQICQASVNSEDKKFLVKMKKHNSYRNEDDRSHSHCHHHHDDLNIRAAAIHILDIGDILQSIGVIIGSIAIYFSPQNLKIIDPILTIIFSVIVLFTTKKILADCVSVLMQSTPRHHDLEDITERIEKIPEVKGVHNLHIWSLTLNKPILSAHVVVDGDASVILKKITDICRKQKIYHSTIQMETLNEKNPENQLDCKQNVY